MYISHSSYGLSRRLSAQMIVTGEIDIDSDSVDPFSNNDKHFLDRIINLIGMRL